MVLNLTFTPQDWERTKKDWTAWWNHELDRDGKGQIPHVDMLLSIKNLKGIQWIPGDGSSPPEEWLPLLKRTRDAGRLCQLYVTAEGALKIAREIGGKGFTFMIDLVPETEMDGLLKVLYSL